jgi:hypothetical protein
MLQKRCHQLASPATTASVTRARLERPTKKHALDVCYQHVTKLQQTSNRESLNAKSVFNLLCEILASTYVVYVEKYGSLAKSFL